MATELARLTLKLMAVQTAHDYAKSMLSNDIEADGVNIDVAEAMRYATKLVKCEIIEMLMRHFDIDAKSRRAIIQHVQTGEFAPKNRVVQPSPQNNDSVKVPLEKLDQKSSRMENELKRVTNVLKDLQPETP